MEEEWRYLIWKKMNGMEYNSLKIGKIKWVPNNGTMKKIY